MTGLMTCSITSFSICSWVTSGSCWAPMTTLSMRLSLPIAVFHSDLGLAVRAQVGHDLFLAHLRQPAAELVRQSDGERHELGRLVAGEAHHHALVAGADQSSSSVFCARPSWPPATC